MKLIEKMQTKIKEPSGLTTCGEFLYTVSDKTNLIYQLSFKGEIIKSFDFEGFDLEGITIDWRDKSFWLCDEKKHQIVHVSPQGKLIKKYPVSFYAPKGKSGMEGICMSPIDNHLWVVNEKKPAILVELDQNLEAIKTAYLDCADDFSGLCFHPETNMLWMVSDESKLLIQYDPENILIKKYPVEVCKAEGLAISGDSFYIIDDQDGILYHYTFNK
jgi:uncharacterized protein YjiK